MNNEFNSLCRKKNIPIPLKHIDVTRATHTNLDVLQEKGDHWNVDSNRSVSDSWKGFTKFTLLKEKLPNEVWTKIGKATREREKLELGKREAKTRRCSKVERHSFH